MLSACSYVYADKIYNMFSKCPPPERMHASERLLRTRPTFSETVMVSVGVSKVGGENKRCLLPRRAADAEVIASHWA